MVVFFLLATMVPRRKGGGRRRSTCASLLFCASVACGFAPAQTARADPTADRADGAPWHIKSDSACPEGARVEAALWPILGVSSDTALGESIELTHEGSGLAVRMRSREGAPLGERVLPLGEDCEELARAAAVVLASWLTDAHPEFLAPPPPPPAPAPEPLEPAPPRVLPIAKMTARGEVTPGPGAGLYVGLGGGAALLGAPPAALGTLLAGYGPSSSGLGLEASVGTTTMRSKPLDAGHVHYTRFPFAVCASLRFAAGRARAELLAGAAVAWLRLSGDGFAPDRSQSDRAFAALAGARLSGRFGALEPFAELRPLLWLTGATAYVDTPEDGVALPRGELFALAGVVYRPPLGVR